MDPSDKIASLMKTAITIARKKPSSIGSFEYLRIVWANFRDVYPDWNMFCNEVAGLIPTTDVRKMAASVVRNKYKHGFKN